MAYDAPLFSALKNYIQKNRFSFHMPGHKKGKGIPRKFKKDILSLDLTELSETDNLHNPEGSILEAQNIMAKAFKAKQSFFLVNGATCGIQAMVTAICNPGDILIIDRNCHSSVISALILAGIIPKYIYPEYIEELGVCGGIPVKELEQVLINNPGAKGVLVTSPNYYGLCSDIKAIADLVHFHNKLLLVDEAHGAHFYFSSLLPKGALELGADMCVHGAHKTLPALTQSALLHVNSDKINIQRLKNSLRLFQTSSPSFLLLAYLDISRSIMQNEGREKLSKIIKFSNSVRENVNNIEGLYCFGIDIKGKYSVHDIDLTRLVFNIKDVGITGYEASEILRDKYNIEVEMVDLFNIVCIATVSDRAASFKKLISALVRLSKELFDSQRSLEIERLIGDSIIKFEALNKDELFYSISPRRAFFSDTEHKRLDDSIGKVSADTVAVFPPGIPVVCPGEVVTENIINYINEIKRSGGKIVGLKDKEFIRVVI